MLIFLVVSYFYHIQKIYSLYIILFLILKLIFYKKREIHLAFIVLEANILIEKLLDIILTAAIENTNIPFIKLPLSIYKDIVTLKTLIQ